MLVQPSLLSMKTYVCKLVQKAGPVHLLCALEANSELNLKFFSKFSSFIIDKYLDITFDRCMRDQFV